MWTEVFEIFTDPAHLIAEFAFEIVFVIITLLLSAWSHRRRDKKHGHHE